jgi:GNAT superfamily N-acetyltransferase
MARFGLFDWAVRIAGANGDLPPMTMEPFGTKWSDGIMARHAEDGRPLGHLHWYGDGEIETVRVHPDFQRRGIASAMLRHANSDPQTYERDPGQDIHHSNNLSAAGRAWANADGHAPADHDIEEADGDPHTWGWTAVKDYVPAHIPYTGQNEEEMAEHLYPEHPHLKVPYKLGAARKHRWPRKHDGDHPDVPFDKRWGPNHPHHIPAPWEQ